MADIIKASKRFMREDGRIVYLTLTQQGISYGIENSSYNSFISHCTANEAIIMRDIVKLLVMEFDNKPRTVTYSREPSDI